MKKKKLSFISTVTICLQILAIAASSLSVALGAIASSIFDSTNDFVFDAETDEDATTHGIYLCHVIDTNNKLVSIEVGCDPEDAKLYNGGAWVLPSKVFKGVTDYKPVEIVDGGFRYCNFTSITLPQTIETMGYESFAYCQSMTTFSIPHLITDIAPSTFLDCRALTNIYYTKQSGSRVLGNHKIKTIGDHAFDSCISLVAFNCPRTLTSIGKSAFQKCQTLSSFNFAPQVEYSYYVKKENNSRKVYKKEGNSWVLQSGTLIVTQGQPSTSDEGDFCLDNSEASNPHLYIHTNQGWVYEGDVLFDTKDIASVPFENQITIGSFAFTDCSSLAKIYFEPNMHTINDYAFTDCNENLEINYTGSSIPNFSANWRRKYIATNKNNSSVGPGTSNHLIKVNINQSKIREDDNYAGLRYTIESGPIYIDSTRKTSNKVILDSSHEKFACITEFIEPIDSIIQGQDYDYDYYNATASRKEIFIPDTLDGYTVKIISNLAFSSGGGNLKKIHFNKSLVQIGHQAFKDCKNIDELDFGKCINLKEIAYKAFNNTLVTSLALPNCLEYIGNRAFYGFTKCTTLSFKTDEGRPAHLKAIGERAFELLGQKLSAENAKTNLILPNSLNDKDAEKADLNFHDNHDVYKYCAISRHAFDDADAILTVEMEEPTQEQRNDPDFRCSFGTSAFVRCDNLFRFKTSDNLDTIGTSCFKSDNNIREIFLATYKASTSKYDYPWGRGNGTEINNFTGPLFISATVTDLIIYVDGPAPRKLGQESYGVKDVDFVTSEKDNAHYKLTPEGWNTERAGSYHFDVANSTTKITDQTISGVSNGSYHYSRTNIPTYYNVDWQNSGVVYWNPKSNNSSQFTDAPVSINEYNSGRIAFVKEKKEKERDIDRYIVTRYYTNNGNAKSEINLSSIPTTYSRGFMQGYISSHLKTIGNEAFGTTGQISSGKYFILPSKIEHIGERAFFRHEANSRVVTVTYDNSGSPAELTNFTYANNASNGYCYLPSSVKTIGKNAFYNHRFQAISLGENVNYLGKGAFYIKQGGDSDLVTSSVNVSASNIQFENINNGIYYTGGNSKFLLYQSSAITGKMTIDSDTKAIGMHAAGNTKYSSVYAPSSLDTIYGGAFQRNTRLQNFVGGTGIRYIGALVNPEDNEVYRNDMPFGITDYRTIVNTKDEENDISRFAAFRYNTSLVNVNFNRMTSLKKIGYSAFQYCTNLTNSTYFIDASTPTLYLKDTVNSHTEWVAQTGSVFSSGTSNPDSSVTTTYYFNTNTYVLYQKNNTTWSEIKSGVAINENSAPMTYKYYSDTSTYTTGTSGVLDLSNCTQLRSIGRDAFISCSNINYVHLPNTTGGVVSESNLYVSTDPETKNVNVSSSAVLTQNNVKILMGETVHQADNNKGASGLNASSHYSATCLGNGNSNVNLRYYYAKSIFDIITTGSNIDNIRYWTDVSGGYRLFEGRADAVSYFESETANNITISFDSNGGTGSMASVTNQKPGNTYTLPNNSFTAPEGKMFKCWRVTIGSGVGSRSTTMKQSAKIYINSNTNITIQAVWKKASISFSANGGTGSMSNVDNPTGSYVLPENGFTAPTGKIFSHWSIGGIAYNPGDTITLDDDSTVVAAEWVDASTITFSAGTGGSGSMSSINVAKNSYYTLPSCDFVNDGKFFKEWKINDVSYQPGDVIKITGNTTITAVWDTPIISFNANGGTGTMADVTDKGYLSTYTLPDNGFTAPSGKVFRCWSVNGVEYEPGDTIVVTNSMTVYPVWETAVTISYSAGTGGTGSMASVSNYPTNKTYTLPDNGFTAPEGKVFRCWLIGGKEYAPGSIVTITGNTTITAVWESVITLTFDSGIGGSGTMSDVEIAANSEYTLPECTFISPDGKAFKGWEINGKIYSSGDTIKSNVLSEDTTITAVWENTVSVSFDSNSGSGTMSNVSVLAGTDYTLPECTFTPPSGTAFTYWLIGNTIFYPGETVNISGNTEIKAVWSTPVNITFAAGDGTGSMTAGEAAPNSYYTLPDCTLTPPSGKAFAGWDIGGTIYQPGQKIFITTAITATAAWDTAVNLSFNAGTGGTGTMSDVSAAVGLSYLLPECGFTAPSGKMFAGWSVNGIIYQAGTRITITGAMTITATWGDTATITFNANGGTGSMSPLTVLVDSEYKLPTCSFTAPEGKKFAGWQIGDSLDTIRPGASVIIDDDVTIKPIWVDIPSE